MNIYLFWILFLALWAIVPLMIIKGRVDDEPKIQTSPKGKEKHFLIFSLLMYKVYYLNFNLNYQ